MKFFDEFVNRDGVVTPLIYHFIQFFTVFILAASVYTVCFWILGGPVTLFLGLAATVYAFFTWRADKRINGAKNDT